MLTAIFCLWLLHVSALAVVEKRLPQTLNPESPEYNSFWRTAKHFFKTLSPPTLLCITFFVDRCRKCQKYEDTVNQAFFAFVGGSSVLLAVFILVSPVGWLNFCGRNTDVFYGFFAQIVWLCLVALSYLVFRKRFNSYQSVFLSVLTLLSAELSWEFPLNIRSQVFAMLPVTYLTLYLARFIPLYLLLAYGLMHKIGTPHYFPFIWIPGVVSSLILFFSVCPNYPPFWNAHYFRAVWAISYLGYAYMLAKGNKSLTKEP